MNLVTKKNIIIGISIIQCILFSLILIKKMELEYIVLYLLLFFVVIFSTIKFDIISLINITLYYAYISFGIKTILYYGNDEYYFFNIWVYNERFIYDNSTILKSFRFFIIGLYSLFIGYYLIKSIKLSKRRSEDRFNYVYITSINTKLYRVLTIISLIVLIIIKIFMNRKIHIPLQGLMYFIFESSFVVLSFLGLYYKLANHKKFYFEIVNLGAYVLFDVIMGKKIAIFSLMCKIAFILFFMQNYKLIKIKLKLKTVVLAIVISIISINFFFYADSFRRYSQLNDNFNIIEAINFYKIEESQRTTLRSIEFFNRLPGNEYLFPIISYVDNESSDIIRKSMDPIKYNTQMIMGYPPDLEHSNSPMMWGYYYIKYKMFMIIPMLMYGVLIGLIDKIFKKYSFKTYIIIPYAIFMMLNLIFIFEGYFYYIREIVCVLIVFSFYLKLLIKEKKRIIK